MPLNCSSLATKFPHTLGGLKTTATTTTIHVGRGGFFNLINKTHQNNSLYIASLSLNKRNSSQRYCLSSSSSSSFVMEDTKDMGFSTLEPGKYSNELDIAVRAVQMACFLCQKVQESLISKTTSQVQAKDDNSPVTIAGIY
jgi:3'(2'), 5'-bisphosphate nucleotidase